MAVFVVGDVHGAFEKLTGLLQAGGLIDRQLGWAAGDAALWLLGDFFDRGPDGIGVVELIMRLQREAAAAGGYVGALLGNHEPLLLSAHRFGAGLTVWGSSFWNDWERNGGQRRDIERLTPEHVAWLTSLPAMALVADRLLMHADALFYRRYGRSVEQVNAALQRLLHSDDAAAWDQLLGEFVERQAFGARRPNGTAVARAMLQEFGGRQIIHGHTPIYLMTGQAKRDITAPLIYADGLCVNVDSGMGYGGPGFIYELPALDGAADAEGRPPQP